MDMEYQKFRSKITFSLPSSSTEDHGSFSPLEGLIRPDVTQDSPSSEASSVERESTPGVIKSRARERRREGRSKTFDWAEFRPIAQAMAQQRAQEAESLHADLGELERSRRREERRKRYESVTSSSAEQTSVKEGTRTDFESGEVVGQTDSLDPTSLERQQRVEEVIEQHWQQVEKTPIREERRVPLPIPVHSRDTVELEQLLENYKQGVQLLLNLVSFCYSVQSISKLVSALTASWRPQPTFKLQNQSYFVKCKKMTKNCIYPFIISYDDLRWSSLATLKVCCNYE